MAMIIDRFEGEYAAVEKDGGNIMNIPRTLLPEEARENDIIKKENGIYIIDTEATEARRQSILEKMKKLKFKRSD